tara:strand:- start:2625 stop:3617 length:993 start_codon:yes stop_codon:yes gene_type:complete
MAKIVMVSPVASTPANGGVQQDGTTYLASADHGAGTIGIWCVGAGAATAGSYLDGSGGALHFSNAGVIAPESFTFAQFKTTGPHFSSPLLYKSDLKRIIYTPYNAGAKQVSTWTPTNAASKSFAIRLVVDSSGLADAGAYLEQTEPSDNSLERVGQVFYYEHTTAASGSSATTICTAIRDQINANPNSPFTATGTATLIVTAKNWGTGFKTIEASESGVTASWAATTALDVGVGQYHQVASAERLAEGYHGYHNRINRKMDGSLERHASSTLNYDCFTLEFDTQSGNGVNNAVKYDPMVVELYFDQAVAAAGNLNEVFAVTLGTALTTTY